MWDEAAEAYEKAAHQFEQAKRSHDASSAHVEAAKCRKSSGDSDLAVKAYGRVSSCSVLLLPQKMMTMTKLMMVVMIEKLGLECPGMPINVTEDWMMTSKPRTVDWGTRSIE